jgi:hypothetical protein
MAQAQVTITAVDRTQAAINSAIRSMKTLERTAKVTAKTLNLAFAFFGGGVVIRGATAGLIALNEAAKETDEGKKALDRLSSALKDPLIVSSVEAVTGAMISGFSKVIDVTAQVIENITAISKSSFLKSPDTLLKFLSSVMGGSGAAASAALVSEMVQGSVAGGKVPNAAKTAVAKAAPIAKTEDFAKDLLEIPLEVRENIKALEKMAIQVDLEMDIEESLIDLRDRFSQELERGGELGEIIFDSAEEGVSKLTVFAEEAARQMQQSFAAFLFDPFQDGLRGMLKGFVDMIRQMVAQLLAQQLLLAFLSPFKGTAGIFGQMYGALEKKATGGPVSANRPYIVGERGPELFVPGSSGGIVPNHAMMGGGMTVAPVYNIDARGATADLQSALPGILQENNRRIFEELDRRYGVGR